MAIIIGGGVGTVLYEIAKESGVGIRIESDKVPVSDAVNGVCGMLGLDPLYLANEGTLVMIAPKDKADEIIEVLHGEKYSKNAAIIGSVVKDPKGKVIMTTPIGGENLLPMPSGELLPRIC